MLGRLNVLRKFNFAFAYFLFLLLSAWLFFLSMGTTSSFYFLFLFIFVSFAIFPIWPQTQWIQKVLSYNKFHQVTSKVPDTSWHSICWTAVRTFEMGVKDDSVWTWDKGDDFLFKNIASHYEQVDNRKSSSKN